MTLRQKDLNYLYLDSLLELVLWTPYIARFMAMALLVTASSAK